MPSRFLAKGRGVIGLPLQQPQVATRVTRFERFCFFVCRLQPRRCVLCRRIVIAAGPVTGPPKIGAVALVMWNMRRRHSSHSCQPAAAEPSVKAVRSTPRSGRSEAESLYGRRSGGYTHVSAPGCRFHFSLCAFKKFPEGKPQVTPPVTVSNPFCAQPLHPQQVPAAATFSNLAAPEPG